MSVTQVLHIRENIDENIKGHFLTYSTLISTHLANMVKEKIGIPLSAKIFVYYSLDSYGQV